MWSKPKKERNAKILELKKEGKTNRYIGELFGISPQMVNQVYVRETNKVFPQEEPESLRSALSGRLISALSKYFGGALPGPGVIAKRGACRLGLVDGIGPKSLQMLARALHDHGYIDDPKKWLAGK
jgi:hypothetical protein